MHGHIVYKCYHGYCVHSLAINILHNVLSDKIQASVQVEEKLVYYKPLGHGQPVK